MKHAIHLEHRASSSQSKNEGEPSFGLCDRLNRTRVNSQRQLPTDHDYAVPTREYQTDQSSLKPAQAAARSVFGKKQKQRQRQKQPHRSSEVDTVTPYQANALVDKIAVGSWPIRKLPFAYTETSRPAHTNPAPLKSPLGSRFSWPLNATRPYAHPAPRLSSWSGVRRPRRSRCHRGC